MEKPIKIIIIDDEQEARDILANLLLKYSEVKVVDKLTNVDEGVCSFIVHKPDLVFLDVQMPTKNGFEFVHEINQLSQNTSIIFTTAYHEFAIEAIRHAAFDFLLKPINQVELQKAIARFKNKNEKDNFQKNIAQLLNNINGINKLKLNTRTGYQFINPDEVLYLEADGNYTNIHCLNQPKFVSTLNLGKQEGLLSHNKFIKISRSTIINKTYLTEIDRKTRTCQLYVNSNKIILDVSRPCLKNL